MTSKGSFDVDFDDCGEIVVSEREGITLKVSDRVLEVVLALLPMNESQFVTSKLVSISVITLKESLGIHTLDCGLKEGSRMSVTKIDLWQRLVYNKRVRISLWDYCFDNRAIDRQIRVS